MSVLNDKDWLKTQFVDENLTADEIADKNSVEVNDVYVALLDSGLILQSTLDLLGIKVSVAYQDPISFEDVSDPEQNVKEKKDYFKVHGEEKPAKKSKKAEDEVAAEEATAE